MTKGSYLSFSTAHVSEQTRELLEESAYDGLGRDLIYKGISVYEKGEYGWILFLVSPGDSLPEDLARLVEIAEREGCDVISLDRDEVEDADLPVYE